MTIYLKIFKESVKNLGFKRTFNRMIWTLGLVYRAFVIRTDRVEPHVFAERNNKCQQCPLYNSKDKTCGTAGTMIDGTDEPKGCWCYLPIAAWVKSKQCWIAANEDLPVASAIKGHRWTR